MQRLSSAIVFFFFLVYAQAAFCQKEWRYSLSDLKKMLIEQNSPSSQYSLNTRISKFYLYNKITNKKNLDSALNFASAAYQLRQNYPALDLHRQPAVLVAKVFLKMKRLNEVKAMLADGDPQFRMNLMLTLGEYYLYKPGQFKEDLDSATLFLKGTVKLSQQLHDSRTEQQADLYLIDVKVERGDLIGTRGLFTELGKEGERKNNLIGAAEAYSRLGDHYLFTETEEKLKAYYKAMDLFRRAGQEEERINMLRAIGDVNFETGKLDLSEKQLLMVVSWLKTHHYKNIQDIYYLLSVCNRFKGNFSKALFYAMEAVRTAQLTESDGDEGYYFSCLAQIYNEMGDVKNSVFWYQKTIESLHSQKSEFMYNNLKDLSDYLIKQGKSEEVLKLLNAVHSTRNSTPVENELIAAIKGNCYKFQKNYKLAEKYYLEMLKWEQLAQVHTFNSSDSYYILADFYLSLKSYAKAEFYLKKILNMPAGTYPLSRIKDVYLKLYQADSAKNDLGTALEHFKKYKSLNDTIFNKNRENQIQELLIKYGSDKKEADNKLLRKESLLQRDKLKKAALITKITITGTLALLLIIGLLYIQFKNRKLANQMLLSHQAEITLKNNSLQDLINKQVKLLVEKEWLIKEIHHRVKNNLQVVMSLLNSQINYTNDAVAVSAIRDSQNRMHSISLIHQKLFQSESVASLDIRSYIVELMKFLCDSYHYNQRIKFEFNIPSIQFDIAQAMPLGLIINEAMTNTIKYAFPNNEQGTVTINLLELGKNDYNFVISDNGIGLPNGFNLESSNTLGMTLMKGLSQQIDGNIAITSNHGVSVSIKFKLIKPNDILYQYPNGGVITG